MPGHQLPCSYTTAGFNAWAQGWNYLEEALVQAPGNEAEVLQEGALMGEGEVKGQVAGILPVPHLLHELAAAVHAPRPTFPQEGMLLLPHLQPH